MNCRIPKYTFNKYIHARSQLATIVMAGVNDVGGVCVGGVLGHTICTGLAGINTAYNLYLSPYYNIPYIIIKPPFI